MRSSPLDVAGISLSGLCLAHCLVLPVAAAFLPSVAAWTHADWLHWVFVAVAIPTTTLALRHAYRAGTLHVGVLAAAVLGLLVLVVGASEVLGKAAEIPITVAGSVMLSGAHAVNWRHKSHR